MSAINSIEQITHYQNILHALHEGKAGTLPALPKVDSQLDETALEISYLIYLVAYKIIEIDLHHSTVWDEHYLDYIDKHAELGKYLQSAGKIPSKHL